MSLTSTSEFIKKYWWVPFLFILVSTLLFLVYLKFTSKQTKNPAPLEHVEVLDLPINIKTYTQDGFEPPKNIPKTLPVYESSTEFGFLDRVDELIKKFNVVGERQEKNDGYLGKGVFINGETGQLYIYSDTVTHYPPIISSGQEVGFDKDKLGQTAIDHLASYGLVADIPSAYQVSYFHFQGEESYEDQNPSGASLINFKFPQKISDYEIITSGKTTTVEFNKRNQITRTKIVAQKKFSPLDKYPVISYQKALELLSSGGGFVMSASSEGADTATSPKHRNLNSANLTSAYLAYYDPPSGKTLQPVWVFEASSTVNNLPVIMKIMLPAIPQSLFTGSTQP